jgi:PTH1 family peptidyl-tRNA hydrolase
MSFLERIFARKQEDTIDPAMKYLIAGLGNPGAEYAENRHNIGFMVLDTLAAAAGTPFSSDRHGYTCTLKVKGRHLVLLKPTTFMNLSGKAVRFHLQKHGVTPANLLVITDDISLPFGKIRIRARGSAGGHNGLRSIEEALGNNEYARMRFGVGDDYAKGAQAHYVLSDFSKDEQKDLPLLLDRMAEAVRAFAGIGLERTMNEYNKK